MSKLVGRPIDPHNVNDVKSYFDKLSAQQPPVPTSQIQKEYGEYVNNFYVHPGGVNGSTVNTLDSPIVNTAQAKNPTGLLQLSKGDAAKAHELWARQALSPSGGANSASRDIAVADAQNYD